MDVALSFPRVRADPAAAGASHADDPRKWWALGVLLLAQLMVILDIAIVNIAVPSAQADLHIAPAHVQWIVTAYLLPFGGLLLLGGRIADDTGRKRVLCIATVGFAIASAVGGGATSEGMLFAARAFQGLFAAAMAPALLSMLTLGFPDEPGRTRAFSLYGGVSAAGGALGLVIGGVLTEYVSWRWSLLINVPLSAIVVAGALPLLRESRASATPGYDVPGALLGTSGLLGVIYGIANAAEHGWTDTWTLLPLAAGVAVLVGFVVWEARTPHPLLPLSILRDRTRGGAFLTLSVVYGPGTALVLLILVFLQGPLGEGALSAGLHFLPLAGAAMAGALLSMRLMAVVSARVLIAAGTVLAALGMLAATRVDADATFVADMLPAFVLFGLGSALLFVTANATALDHVPDDDTALTSAVINAMQQVGAALGVAILSSVAVVSGNDRAFVVGAAMILAAGSLAAALVVGRAPPR